MSTRSDQLYPIFKLFLLISLLHLGSTKRDVFSCFLLYPNHYLEKSGALILQNLSSVSECLERCLQAEKLRIIECRSVMWRKESMDCVLSRHSKADREADFHISPSLEIDFYENSCFSNGRMRFVRNINETEIKDDLERRTTVKIHENQDTTQESISATPQTIDPPSFKPNLNNELNEVIPLSINQPRKRAKTFGSTMSGSLRQVTLPSTYTVTSTPEPLSVLPSDFLGIFPNRSPNEGPIKPLLVTSPLNRTGNIRSKPSSNRQLIYSPIGPNAFYKAPQPRGPSLVSLERIGSSIDSRPQVLSVSGDSIAPKAGPIRGPRAERHFRGRAIVFRGNHPVHPRNVRGSVILIPDKATDSKRSTGAPSVTSNSMKPIRPGPVTRHYYRPDAPISLMTTPIPQTTTTKTFIVDSEKMIDSEPVVLVAQRRPNSIVSSGFRATITQLPPSTNGLTTKQPSTTISSTTKTTNPPRELADAPCFLKTTHRALGGFEEKAIHGITLRECLVTCLYITDLYCASVNYDYGRKICIINGGSATLTKTPLQPGKMIDYYENICPPPQPKRIETVLPVLILSRCMTPLVNTILEDLDAQIVSSAQTLEECQSECLRGRTSRGHRCGGLNWMSETRGCMLFPPHYNRQQLAFSTQATFFINLCTDETFDGSTKRSQKADYYDDFTQ